MRLDFIVKMFVTMQILEMRNLSLDSVQVDELGVLPCYTQGPC